MMKKLEKKIQMVGGVPWRRYSFEDEIQCIVNDRKKQSYHVFCFNDLLLFTKKSKKVLKLNTDVDQFRYIEELPLTMTTRIALIMDENPIILITTDDKSVEFFPEIAEDIIRWKNNIEDIVDEHRKNEESRLMRSEKKGGPKVRSKSEGIKENRITFTIDEENKKEENIKPFRNSKEEHSKPFKSSREEEKEKKEDVKFKIKSSREEEKPEDTKSKKKKVRVNLLESQKK